MDKYAQIRDFYFPYVGQEDHVEGHRHKIGVWVDNQFSWFFDGEWNIDIKYKEEALIGDIVARNDRLKVELKIINCVHWEKDIYIKNMIVKNLDNKKREIRIFLNQHFNIFGIDIGNTVYYEPERKVIIFYKGKRYFLINGLCEGKGFSDYATGIADFMNLEGTYKDAEDGKLSKNPIEHGSVDSTISFNLVMEPDSKKEIYYWIAAGEKFKEVSALNNFVLEKEPKNLIEETERYWKAWLNRRSFNFSNLNEKIANLFKTSLLIMRAQTDNRGAIIAANDSDILRFWKDTYSYMWPRDAAITALALDKAGYVEITKNFFTFCNEVLTDDGFLLHKYRPDKSLGSSWHPWVKNGKLQLPIQEDGTALVLHALWNHYEQHKDIEFVEGLYDSLIKKAADFMVEFRDEKTKLPKESYNLWEDKLGISTFTCSTVYAGLVAASKFAELLGKNIDHKRYKKAAAEIRSSIGKYLYDEDEKIFLNMITIKDGSIIKDKTIDISSVYGIFNFGVFDANDERVVNSIKVVEDKLTCKTRVGGIARYEKDQYYRVSDAERLPGNPWFICTLWLAQYYIAKAKNKDELTKALDILNWTVEHALPSGILAEQIHPYTGEPVSVAPLTWSHATFVLTVIDYLEKLKSLS